MNYRQMMDKLDEQRQRITSIRTEMRELQANVQPEAVEDYEFMTPDGKVRLGELFGKHDSLILIHNMGARCRYCTLWADGFNGLVDHLENRAGFVVSSPDAPESQRKFAETRGWRFRMISHADTNFAEEMGYKTAATADNNDSPWQPGVSVFKKGRGGIIRVSDASLGPGDDFCTAWHLFDLLPEGPNDWGPMYRYDE
jgi:predicted dithiol-disulfide oxidoreductase (DUF899 family)